MSRGDNGGKDRITLKVDEHGASMHLVDRDGVAVISLHIMDATSPTPPTRAKDEDYFDKVMRTGRPASASISVGNLNDATLSLSGDHIMMNGSGSILEIGSILARPAAGRFGFGVMRSGGGEGVWSTIGMDQPSIRIFDARAFSDQILV